MFFKPKQKTISFKESVDFFNKSVIHKTPIISVMENIKDEKVEFFMAKDDDVAVLLSKDLKSVGIFPTVGDTYFIVRQINIRKSYKIFKLDRELFNFIVGRL